MFHPLMIINQLLSFYFSIKNSCDNFYIIYTGTPQIVNVISKQDQQISMFCFVKKAPTCFRLLVCYFRKFHSNLSFSVYKDIFNTMKQFIFFVRVILWKCLYSTIFFSKTMHDIFYITNNNKLMYLHCLKRTTLSVATNYRPVSLC